MVFCTTFAFVLPLIVTQSAHVPFWSSFYVAGDPCALLRRWRFVYAGRPADISCSGSDSEQPFLRSLAGRRETRDRRMNENLEADLFTVGPLHPGYFYSPMISDRYHHTHTLPKVNAAVSANVSVPQSRAFHRFSYQEFRT